MGAKPTTIGGGSARGVSDNISNLLNAALNGGGGQQTAATNTMRANPVGQTMDIRQALSTLFQGGSNLVDSAQSIAANRRTEDVGDLRSRYALGGVGYGTPAAVGEAKFLGEFDPQVALGIGNMQLDSITKALGFLSPLLQQAYGLGTPQAQTVMKKGFLGNALDAISGVAGAAAPFLAPGLGSAAAAGGAALDAGGQLGQASIYHFPGMTPGEGTGDFWGGFGIGRDSVGTPFNPGQAASGAGIFGGSAPAYNPWSFHLGGVN